MSFKQKCYSPCLIPNYSKTLTGLGYEQFELFCCRQKLQHICLIDQGPHGYACHLIKKDVCGELNLKGFRTFQSVPDSRFQIIFSACHFRQLIGILDYIIFGNFGTKNKWRKPAEIAGNLHCPQDPRHSARDLARASAGGMVD
jgi:hypothetical protein